MDNEAIDFFPISVEQTDWGSSGDILFNIRKTVFIDEQDVPESEEIDNKDPEAIHWIAWGGKNEPMGVARLWENKIGRMAVLKPYRNKGVGSSILRRMIEYGQRLDFAELQLNAQLTAVAFYQDHGFVVSGDEFPDAGIAHVPMTLDLKHIPSRRVEPSPPDISEEWRNRVDFDSSDEMARRTLDLVEHSDRSICILSGHLEPKVYDNEALCKLIHDLVVSHPSARVKILVKDIDWLCRNHHRLVETAHRLSSTIEIRRLTTEIETPHQEFITGNLHSVLYCSNPKHFTGFLCLHAPIEAKRLNDDFDVLWNHSESDPQLRRLSI